MLEYILEKYIKNIEGMAIIGITGFYKGITDSIYGGYTGFNRYHNQIKQRKIKNEFGRNFSERKTATMSAS